MRFRKYRKPSRARAERAGEASGVLGEALYPLGAAAAGGGLGGEDLYIDLRCHRVFDSNTCIKFALNICRFDFVPIYPPVDVYSKVQNLGGQIFVINQKLSTDKNYPGIGTIAYTRRYCIGPIPVGAGG